jgi:hypothetical protein
MASSMCPLPGIKGKLRTWPDCEMTAFALHRKTGLFGRKKTEILVTMSDGSGRMGWVDIDDFIPTGLKPPNPPPPPEPTPLQVFMNATPIQTSSDSSICKAKPEQI